MFSVAQALFLQTVPVRDADRLVSVYETRYGQGSHPMSYQDYLDYRSGTTAFEELVSHYSTAPLHVVAGERSDLLDGAVVSDDYFSMLSLEPRIGRFFLPEENRAPGADPVAVVSHRLWREWFGADRHVLGTPIDVNGVRFEIVGVAPEGFRGVLVGVSNDLWIPSMMSKVGYRFCDAFRRDCTYLNLMGRLRPGRTLLDARRELERVSARLRETYPDSHAATGVTAISSMGIRPGDTRTIRLTGILVGIVVAVLLVALLNLAGIFAARNESRRAEISMRLALGASRGRIVRQLLTETLLLSALGGLAGLLVAPGFETRSSPTSATRDPGSAHPRRRSCSAFPPDCPSWPERRSGSGPLSQRRAGRPAAF